MSKNKIIQLLHIITLHTISESCLLIQMITTFIHFPQLNLSKMQPCRKCSVLYNEGCSIKKIYGAKNGFYIVGGGTLSWISCLLNTGNIILPKIRTDYWLKKIIPYKLQRSLQDVILTSPNQNVSNSTSTSFVIFCCCENGQSQNSSDKSSLSVLE